MSLQSPTARTKSSTKKRSATAMPYTRALACVFFALLSAGCVDVSVDRIGQRYPPFPETCPIDYQYGDLTKVMEFASNGYVQVGSIMVEKGGEDFDDAMKARVQPEACKLGGNLVVMGSSSPGSFSTNYSYAQMIVLRKVQSGS
jgi:hypothetical protein